MWRELLILAVIFFSAAAAPVLVDLAVQIARFPRTSLNGHLRVVLWQHSREDAKPSVPVEHLLDRDAYDHTR